MHTPQQQQTPPRRDTLTIVLEAVQDLHAQEQPITRHTLRQATGLKLTIIDDRIDALVAREMLHRIERGVYVPAVVHPPARPISKTILSDGFVKVEIGDDVLTLTPREDRIFSQLMAGAAAQYAAIQSGQQMTVALSQLTLRIMHVERENKALRALREGHPQLQLLERAERVDE